jgi:hypothetical protein
MLYYSMSREMGKLKRKLLGGKGKSSGEAPMKVIDAGNGAARPGAWKTQLLPAPTEDTVNKHRQVPLPIDEAIVQDVSDGAQASELETKYQVTQGYVRRVLIRRYGSVEGMKKALEAQCLENAIALNEYARERIDMIPPGQALMGVKLMVDSAVALSKNRQESPATVDFGMLAVLGASLERVEKVILGTDRTVDT